MMNGNSEKVVGRTVARKLSRDCAIVVNSCDAYEDVWPIFFTCLKANLGGIELPIYLNCESKIFQYDALDIRRIDQRFSSGTPWGHRFKSVLEAIDRPYIISLYDDFLLEAPVDLDRLSQAFDFLSERNATVVYFSQIYSLRPQKKEISFLKSLDGRVDYKLNSAPALWKRTKLVEYIKDVDDPWAWEFFGSTRAFSDFGNFYCLDDGERWIFPYSWQLGGGIRRGKWVGSVVQPLLEKHGIDLNLNIRGISSEDLNQEKRSFKWKLRFLFKGYQMVGIAAFVYAAQVLIRKLLINEPKK